MAGTVSSAHSLWLDTAPETAYAPLTGDLEVDVVIVGAGIAGLTTALLLIRDGARVAVLDAARVGSGVTGCTTAKVSALQSTIYSTIERRNGRDAARVYAEASTAGVEQLASIVAELGIDCDLQRRDAYTYAARLAERASVEREAEVTARAGLPTELVAAPDLPFRTYGAVRLANQLQIHPVRYVQGLASAVADGGGSIFESSRATGVKEGARCEVKTEAAVVRAEHVVVASHFPFLDRGGYFARLKPQRSYCVAARLNGDTPPQGMSISAGSPTRSVRGAGELLIIGGESHPAGSRDASPERYAALAAFARQHWDVAEITHQWSAQDPTHYDHLPVIGPYRPGSKRLWVTTGFMKWGLATASFGAQILADRIAGRDNPWAATFTPSRLSPRSLHEPAQLGAKFTADMIADRVRPAAARSAEEVPAGEARIVSDGLGRKGVYRDDDGGVHAVSLRCTHMGCLLRWNGAERSWDCPCHGSRFDTDGAVLEGPAVQPLERRDA